MVTEKIEKETAAGPEGSSPWPGRVRRRVTLVACLLGAAAWLGGAGLGTARAGYFEGIAPLPGHFQSKANGVSADGSTVVGSSSYYPFEQEAIRWTRGGGAETLGGGTEAVAVSADGSRIAGYGATGFVWDSAGGYQGGYGSAVIATSADGRTVAGYGQDGGTVWGPGGMSVAGGNTARGLSADGATALVTFQQGFVGGFTTYKTYRWTEAGGLVTIGHAPGQEKTLGQAISADGTTVVGIHSSRNYLINGEAFSWTEAGGFVGLGRLFADGSSTATGITTTGFLGRMILGDSVPDGTFPSEGRAFLWTEGLGMVDLKTFLTGYGLGAELAGWTLTNATGISADGRTLVGHGFDPTGQSRGWVASIDAVPEPAGLALLAIGGLGLAGLWRRRAVRSGS